MVFLLSSPVVTSLKLLLYLRAAAVEYCCRVTHPGRWFVTTEDGGRRKTFVEGVGQVHLCMGQDKMDS